MIQESLPTAQFAMKESERIFHEAEQLFIYELSILLETDNKDSVFPLRNELINLGSANMADIAIYAYGFEDGICHSDNDTSRVFGTGHRNINAVKKVAIQSLLFKYGQLVDDQDYYDVLMGALFHLS